MQIWLWKANKLTGLFPLILLLAAFARAHQPMLEQPNCQCRNLIECAVETLDPTYASSATYGNLSLPREVDAYKFTAQLSCRQEVNLSPLRLLNPLRLFVG